MTGQEGEQSLEPYAVNTTARQEKQLRQHLTSPVSKYILLDSRNQQLLLAFLMTMLKSQEKPAGGVD